MAHTSNYALRLLPSVKAEAEKVAAAAGTTLNQFINGTVAEKLAALRTAQVFQERAVRAALAVFDRLLDSAGGKSPRPGDEIDADTRRTLRTRMTPPSLRPRPARRQRGNTGAVST